MIMSSYLSIKHGDFPVRKTVNVYQRVNQSFTSCPRNPLDGWEFFWDVTDVMTIMYTSIWNIIMLMLLCIYLWIIIIIISIVSYVSDGINMEYHHVNVLFTCV